MELTTHPLSIAMVLKPARWASMVQASPVGPAPITTTSADVSAPLLLCGRGRVSGICWLGPEICLVTKIIVSAEVNLDVPGLARANTLTLEGNDSSMRRVGTSSRSPRRGVMLSLRSISRRKNSQGGYRILCVLCDQ